MFQSLNRPCYTLTFPPEEVIIRPIISTRKPGKELDVSRSTGGKAVDGGMSITVLTRVPGCWVP